MSVSQKIVHTVIIGNEHTSRTCSNISHFSFFIVSVLLLIFFQNVRVNHVLQSWLHFWLQAIIWVLTGYGYRLYFVNLIILKGLLPACVLLRSKWQPLNRLKPLAQIKHVITKRHLLILLLCRHPSLYDHLLFLNLATIILIIY